MAPRGHGGGVMLAGACQEGRSRTTMRLPVGVGRAGEVPWDGSTAMSDGQPPFEDVDWREVSRYQPHTAGLIAAPVRDMEAPGAPPVHPCPPISYRPPPPGRPR